MRVFVLMESGRNVSFRFNLYPNLLFFAVILFHTLTGVHTQLEGGSIAKCEVEGEVIKLPILAGNPCITCICKNKEVVCRRERCPDLTGCSLVVSNPSTQCCTQCKSCSFNGEHYSSGDVWFPTSDSCQQFQCQESVVTASRVQCFILCSNPIYIEGQCCPYCEGCVYDGSRHDDGEVFTASDDPCVQCKCEGKNVKCTRQVCPVLSCPDTHRRTQPGQCCPSCIVQRRVFELGNKCIYKSDVYEDGEVIIVDKCTRCTCIDTTFMCHRQVCSDSLPCGVNDQVIEDGACCPKCRRKMCQVEDKIYEEGDTWSPSTCEDCKCTADGVICNVKKCQYKYRWCPRNQEFKVPLGECCPRCMEKNGVCTVYGDPHYQTFDQKTYSFQGNCKYVLAKDCLENSFTVKVKNDDRNTGLYSWTKTVFFNIGSYSIVLLPYYKVKVNQELISLPYSLQGIDIAKENTLITVKTNIGVSVSWDGDSFAEVEVDTSFKGKLCGLCGNYNDDDSDDYMTPDGQLLTTTKDFVKSWKVGKNSCEKKSKDEPKEPMHFPCQKVSSIKRMKAHMMCKVLKSDSFKECREVIDYMHYHRSCIVDMCECPRNKMCSCEAITAYSRACQRKGIEVGWSPEAECEAQVCPEGAMFDVCGPACERTCKNRYENQICDKPCVAGCHCKAGYVMNRNRCIKAKYCPE